MCKVCIVRKVLYTLPQNVGHVRAIPAAVLSGMDNGHSFKVSPSRAAVRVSRYAVPISSLQQLAGLPPWQEQNLCGRIRRSILTFLLRLRA